MRPADPPEPGEAAPAPRTTSSAPSPAIDPTRCELCGAPLEEVHCKVICRHCGFVRDCSDP